MYRDCLKYFSPFFMLVVFFNAVYSRYSINPCAYYCIWINRSYLHKERRKIEVQKYIEMGRQEGPNPYTKGVTSQLIYLQLTPNHQNG